MKFLSKLVYKIKKRENRFWDFFYRIAKSIRAFSLPGPKFIFHPIFWLYKITKICFRFALQKFFYEPMFKSLCMTCGKQFRIQKGMPLIIGNVKISIGDNVVLSGKNTFASPAIHEETQLIIGNYTHIGYESTIFVGKKVEIGEHCLIADRVLIVDNDTHPVDPERRKRLERVRPEEIKPVRIGNNVWIGYQSFIGKGVTIGNNAIIGSNAVVLNDVPENAIMIGNPARKFAVATPARFGKGKNS